jgi:hypothetical protein
MLSQTLYPTVATLTMLSHTVYPTVATLTMLSQTIYPTVATLTMLSQTMHRVGNIKKQRNVFIFVTNYCQTQRTM